MSLLPSAKTFSSPGNTLYATQQEFIALSNNVSAIDVTAGVGSGINVTSLGSTFDLGLNLSNAGGISFLTYPGLNTIGLSNAGVTQLTAGSGIGVSGATGSVTVSNTGVNSVTAGPGITVSGTATAPVINNTISAGVNVVQNQFSTSPISATTPPGGAPTTIVTYGGFITGKTYLICLNLALSSSTTDDNKTCTIGIKFASIPELYSVMTIPNNTSGYVENATCAITIPAGETSFAVQVSGFGYTTETAIGSINNSVIIPMN